MATDVLLLSLLAAAVPVLLYVGLIYWADRYEKEPVWLLSAAFLWGAVPAALLALLFNTLLSAPFYLLLDSGPAEVVAGGLIAPIIEETAKAIVLFLILFFWRQELDSPIDGLIYGAMVGMGFAMVENVLYYMNAFEEGGQAAWNVTVVMRGLVFGLSHALYTSLTGLGIAIARLTPNPILRIIAPLAGLAAAIALHAFHNLAMFAGTSLTFLAGLTFDWGGVALTAVIIALLLYQEREWMKRYLADEVALGTLTAEEYDLVRSAARRNRLRFGLLLRQGPNAYRLSGRRYRECSELAYHKRHHAVFGDERSRAAVERLRGTLRSSQYSVSSIQ
jgi:RsiW-degrading membrane proteinase PrsW (M82 family)